MVPSDKKLANAMGGKTARACDNCIRKRARWYCAADDAFLCQSCDAFVHSADPLASDHERFRLKVASLKLSSLDTPAPSWHQGFTKKSRTPRGNNSNKHAFHRPPKSEESINPLHLVPEIGSDELNTITSDEQLLYQVPVFDPFAGELCFSGDCSPRETKHDESKVPFNLNSLNGLMLPSDLELAEFAADAKSLLGKGLDDETFDIEGLGLLDCRLKDTESLKVEEDMQCEVVETKIEMMKESFQLCFDYDSSLVGDDDHVNHITMVKEDEECEVVCDDHVNVHTENYDNIHDPSKKNKKILLKLDYDGIIGAWDDQRSPWTTGNRPELDPNDCWPVCIGGCGKMHHNHCEDTGKMMGNLTRFDEGREARVSRYREKRQRRLFSKKIRYEVRKLNAEKRPRMKGRFVKRANLPSK